MADQFKILAAVLRSDTSSAGLKLRQFPSLVQYLLSKRGLEKHSSLKGGINVCSFSISPIRVESLRAAGGVAAKGTTDSGHDNQRCDS